MRRVALLCVAALGLAPTPSLSQITAGNVFVKASVGIAGQSLDDWDNVIDEIETQIRDELFPSFDHFGAAVPFGGEIGYQISPALALSMGVVWQRHTVENSHSFSSGSLSLKNEVGVTSFTGNVSYAIPGGGGFFISGDLGVGLSTAKSDYADRDFSTPTNDIDINGDWSGNAMVAGFFTGYQRQYSRGLLIHVRLGYQFQNLGKLDGSVTDSRFGTRNGPPLDAMGRPLETDLSGVQLMAGVGVAFKRK